MPQPFRKNIQRYLFCGLFIALFFFMGFHRIFNDNPQSIHAWRQSDSYAIALSYYYENNKFFEPHLLYTGTDGDRQAISEFPILYYLTAKIWKLTGVNPAVLKLINFLILFTGLYYLSLLVLEILEDRFWSIILILLLFSSPLIGYYGYNFIPNIPALGFAMIALYYFYQYWKTTSHKALIAATALYLIAALLKVTSLLSYFAIICALLLTKRQTIFQTKKQAFHLALSFIIIIGGYIIWNRYAHVYNQQHLSFFFNQSIIPIWQLEKTQISATAQRANERIFPLYFYRPAFYAVLLLFVTVILGRKSVPKILFRTILFIFFGILAFILLFFQGLNEHDYFLINTLIFIPGVLLLSLLILKNKRPNWLQSYYLKTGVLLILLFLLNNEMILSRSHYNPHQKIVRKNLPLDKTSVEYWNYIYWTMELTDFQYEGIKPYLRDLGISFNSPIISIGDFSPNRTLCWMETKGFTKFGREHKSMDEFIRESIELGAEYLVYNENDKPNLAELSPFLKDSVGTFNKLHIYSVRLPNESPDESHQN